jgi:3-isopropylmalate dehydrogenase
LAAILSGSLLLDTLGEAEAAKSVEDAAVKVVSTRLKGLETGRMGYSTSEVGDLVADCVAGK